MPRSSCCLLRPGRTTAPAPAGSKYELWLIDRGVTDPRSLGTITGTEDVVVPSSIDPDEYAIVDISNVTETLQPPA